MANPLSDAAQALYDIFFPGNTGQSYTYQSVHNGDTEQGTDIFAPAGLVIRLPVNARYVWSNGYQSVFQLADGTAISITHILARTFTPGQLLPAGENIGTVAPLSATPKGYYSTATHLELGVYNTPSDAISWNNAATRDPVAWLASIKGSGDVSGGYKNPVIVGPGGITDPSHYLSGNLPQIDWTHLLLVGGLGVALIGVLLLLLAQLARRSGVLPAAAATA